MDYFTRRRRFLEKWSGEPFLLHGATRPTDAVPWRQDRDFLYLTGVNEPNATLQFRDGEWTLFLEERSQWDALWHGERPSFEEVSKRSGIERIVCHSEPVRQAQGKLREESRTNVRSPAFAGDPSALLQDDTTEKVKSLIHAIRLIKDADEITALKKANEISLAMFSAFDIEPGMREAEIEGELYRRMRAGGGEGWAYPPIVASGVNATTLHYTKNNRAIESGGLVLIDAGAEYAGYAADITRTLCAGEMRDEQKVIYNLVAEAQRAARAVAVAGKTLADVDAAARVVLRNGLVELNVLKDASSELGAEKIFFPHRTSHWLGLDVHDPCPIETPLAAGVSFTIEPGLYFRDTDDPLDIYRGRLKEEELDNSAKALGEWESYRGIGVRIEDDIIIEK